VRERTPRAGIGAGVRDDDPWGPDEWVRLFVCPRCRGDLVAVEDALRCPACRLRYPVRDGVPYLAEDLAERE
jgi:uncharacterized protein